MADQLPHSLSTAYASLVNTLAQAEDLYRRTLRYPNPGLVLEGIERFVHELSLLPICLAELQHRSTLVEQLCSSGSRYDGARQEALQSHTSLPTVLCGAKLALERLRNPGTEHPLFLQNVIDVRKNIEILLADASAGLSASSAAAFNAWRDESRRIQLDAERLHVDGCWYLLHAFQAAAPGATDRDQSARVILKTTMGGAHLADIRAAVESIVAWLSETGLPTAMRQKSGDDEVAPEAGEVRPLRTWPPPGEHTTAKLWTRKDGVLCLSTKTDGIRDGRVEFAPTVAGELTNQMRFMQVMSLIFPETATLATVMEQVYPKEFAAARLGGAALQSTLRKLRSLVSDIRTKKLARAGLNPDILPPLNIESSPETGIGLRLAHLHRLDDKELDEADHGPD